MATETRQAQAVQRRSPWRARDARAVRQVAGAYRAERGGFTVLELLVAMSIFFVVVGTALPALPRNPYAAWIAQAQVLAELRRARNDALTKGDHFRVVVTGPSSYETYRLSLVGQNWMATDPPVRQGILPDGVVFTTATGSQFEFTTRGLMVNPGGATTIWMDHVDSGAYKGVVVWPSGQVASA